MAFTDASLYLILLHLSPYWKSEDSVCWPLICSVCELICHHLFPGVVTKMKMQRTIVIRRDYLHYIRKYNRFEKRHKNMSVHLSPCFR